MTSSRILDKGEAAEYLRLAVSTLDKLRINGTGPVFSKPVRKILYRVEDLDAWVAASMRRSTAEGAAA